MFTQPTAPAEPSFAFFRNAKPEHADSPKQRWPHWVGVALLLLVIAVLVAR